MDADMPGPVVAILKDGTRVPCEVYFLEVEGAETIWKVTATFRAVDVAHFEIGVMPAHTGIQFEFT